jgi:DNA-binding transcriptional ArsR family regulator
MFMRRDGLVFSGEAIEAALGTFEANMRPTDASGKLVGMDLKSATKALIAPPSEPHRPFTCRSDIPPDLSALVAKLDARASDVAITAITSITATPAVRERAEKVRSALESIPAGACLGGDEKRPPLPASIVLGRALRFEFKGADEAVGAALAAEWDQRAGGSASRAFEKADPHYSKGAPLTQQSIFALARANGWVGDEAKAKPSREALVCVTIHDLLSRELPRMEPLLAPWLATQSLNLVHAWRGVGKTFFALNVAYAVASGGEFLGWRADVAREVLYIDGEMPGAAMQERLSGIVMASAKECDPDNFRIITPDLQTGCMPDLATVEGQEDIEAHITEGTKLVVIDNLSALVRRGGRENDAESWLSVAEWAMGQRARGKSVLFVHHEGKGGTQRGTSKKEDILDTVIRLSRPADYDPSREGARFNVEFAKDRHRAAGEPFEALLTTGPDGLQAWTTRTLEASREDQIVELVELGMTVSEIAEEVGLHKSNVSRAIKKLEDEGRIKPRGKAGRRARPLSQGRGRADVDG